MSTQICAVVTQPGPLPLLPPFIESCPDPVIWVTLEGVINLWNPAAAQVYGYAAGEAIGQPLSILAPRGL